METHKQITLEVAFALPEKQLIISLICENNITVFQAIAQSGIKEHFPDYITTIDNNLSVGIFGKKIDPQNYQLQNHDRIEIYRGLNKSPNQKRLERAKK